MLGAKLIQTLTLVTVCFYAIPSCSQINMGRYLDPRETPFLSPSDYVDVKFHWNMNGKIQVFINEGLNFLKEGKPIQAISNFDESLKLDSTLWVSHYYRGICYKTILSLKDAEKDFLAAIRLNTSHAEFYLELGEVYQLQTNNLKASELYRKVVRMDPSLAQGYYNLASIAITKSDVSRALRFYDKCNEVNPTFAPAYLMKAILRFKSTEKGYDRFLLFNKAIATDSSYSQAYFWRGLAYVSTNQTQKCLVDWNTMIRLNPDNYFLLLMRGFLHVELGNYDYAFSDLRKALLAREIRINQNKFVGGQTLLDKKIDLQFAAEYLVSTGYGLEEESFGHLKEGFCMLLAGQPEKALIAINSAERVQTSAPVYFIKALTFENLTKHDSSFVYYNKALALDNDIFDAHKKRGVYRYELKDWKGAYSDFNEMVRLQPKAIVTYRLRGGVKFEQTDYYGAIIDLTRFIKTDSTDATVWEMRARARKKVGDVKGAIDDLNKIVPLQPKNWLVYKEISENNLLVADTAKAISVMKECIDRLNSVGAHLELMKIYIYTGAWKSALSELDKLKKVTGAPDPFNTKAYSELFYWEGRIEFQKHLYRKAVDKFNKSLRKDPTNLEAKYFRAKANQSIGYTRQALSDLGELKASGFLDAQMLYDSLSQKQQN
jgi:tetratricopeptide (TPR) repeat protein